MVMSDDSIGELGLRISFDSQRPTLHVVGDLDVVAAPSLAGVLHALIDDGHHQLAVDLAGLTFMDARGLGVLAETASRTIGAGGSLSIHNAPAFIRRMLDITHLSDRMVFTTSVVSHSKLDRRHAADEQLASVGEPEASVPMVSQHGLVRSSTDVIDAALRLVTALAGATVDNADGVSVTLERHGRLMTVAASNEAVSTMDRHQYETGEGPCLDAKAQGRWFYIESLADETRWPTFVPLALDQGIHSILSSPLMTRNRPQGALNIYSSTKQAFGTHEQELAALFADQASQILTTAGPDLSDEQSNERFATALTARQQIHQAQGVIMERDDVNADEAYGSLLRQARTAGITVLARACEILTSGHSDDGHA